MENSQYGSSDGRKGGWKENKLMMIPPPIVWMLGDKQTIGWANKNPEFNSHLRRDKSVTKKSKNFFREIPKKITGKSNKNWGIRKQLAEQTKTPNSIHIPPVVRKVSPRTYQWMLFFSQRHSFLSGSTKRPQLTFIPCLELKTTK